MEFKDLGVNDIFVKEGQNNQCVKVAEVRVSCCKVKCNAKRRDTGEDMVFRPLDKVTKINEK